MIYSSLDWGSGITQDHTFISVKYVAAIIGVSVSTSNYLIEVKFNKICMMLIYVNQIQSFKCYQSNYHKIFSINKIE